MVIGGVAVGTVAVLVKLISGAVRTFSKLPGEVQVVLIVGAILLALHPASRKTVSNSLSSLAERLKGSAGEFVAAMGPLTIKLGEVQLDLKANQDMVESVIPRR